MGIRSESGSMRGKELKRAGAGAIEPFENGDRILPPLAGADIGAKKVNVGACPMLSTALATIWRQMGKRGVVIIAITAFACLLVIQSPFSTAIWGENRESGLFVLVGLAAFGGAVLTLLWALIFPVRVLVEWNRLTSSSMRVSETTPGSINSSLRPTRNVTEDTASDADASFAIEPPKLTAATQHDNNGSPRPSLDYLPNAVGITGAVIGIIASISAAQGAEVITLTAKLAGLGYLIGYPVGVLIRATIRRLSRAQQ